jgi:hypothetical protein
MVDESDAKGSECPADEDEGLEELQFSDGG